MGESIMYLQFPTFREGRRDSRSKSNTEQSLITDLLTMPIMQMEAA
jgi:hypothetical protein